MNRSSPWTLPVATLGALALLVAITIPAHSDPCPASIVQLNFSDGPFSTPAAVYDSARVGTGFPAHVSFDRLAAHLSMSGDAAGRLRVAIRVVERFDLLGSAPGVPVAATLEFRPTGSASNNCASSGCGIEFSAALCAGPDSVVADASGQAFGAHTLPPLLTLPVTLTAGSPLTAQFFMVFSCGPGGSGTVDSGGTWDIAGLPPGVRAVSCPGGDVTPVGRSSWGALKIRYR